MNKTILRATRRGTLEDVASLIAVLVLNDEAKQAKELAGDVKKIMHSKEAVVMIDAALK